MTRTPIPVVGRRGVVRAVARALLAMVAAAPACLRPPSQAAPGTGHVTSSSPATAALPAAPPPARAVAGLPTRLAWSGAAPILAPKSDATHDLVAIKDPTLVRYRDRWHVYATSVARGGIYGMVYTSFADFSEAAQAPLYYMDRTPGFDTYVAAPQLFYFAPKHEWFLIFQSGPPMFSTAPEPDDPTKWAAPQAFFAKTPAIIDQHGWLDFWVVCDPAHCHLFFSNDHGRWYKSKTPIDRFPRGFDQPVVVMEDAEAGRLFEACNVYKIAGSDTFLALIEAFDKSSGYKRYFRSWTAESLEGPWTVLHDDASAPFAGEHNVSFDGGPWTQDISHGELVRAGHDQTMTIDGTQLQYLYQGYAAGHDTRDYNAIPWQLGLLTAK